MKSLPTLTGAAALAAGALILSGALAVAPAQAAVTADQCKQADVMADGVYEMALKNTRLYPTPKDAAAAAMAAYTRRILAEHRGYGGDGKGATEQHEAKSLCNRKGGFPPTGPWV
ncbi:MAG: hypothetical protein Q8L23_11250 [Caulobacter sp.]|nr:hypothetical protein [Caulobacter sp.]